MKCSNCDNEIECCDSCGEDFKVGQEIKCTEKLGHEHECNDCFNDDYKDAEVEK